MTTTKTWAAIYQIGLGAEIVAVFLDRDRRETVLAQLRTADQNYWWQDVMVSDTTTRKLHDAFGEA